MDHPEELQNTEIQRFRVDALISLLRPTTNSSALSSVVQLLSLQPDDVSREAIATLLGLAGLQDPQVVSGLTTRIKALLLAHPATYVL